MMFRWIDIRIALGALTRHRLRTGLTTMGLSIGIAAVMITVALGDGASGQVQAQLDALGEDFVWIQSGAARTAGAREGWGTRRSLYPADIGAIVREAPDVALCSPIVSGREQVVTPGENWNTRYQGVSPEFLAIRRWPLSRGSNFTDHDMQTLGRVLILGGTVAERLYGTADAVGRQIRMGRFQYSVIGVLESRGVGRGGVNLDDMVLLPYTTAQRRVEGITWVDEIVCSARDALRLPQAEAQIAMALRLAHELDPDDPDDFRLSTPLESLQMRVESADTMTLMTASVAAVSLLVGGIGIMNIMLVSVAERTREIGVRLAIGARMRDIRRQFLAESLSLGCLGGVFGVAAGLSAMFICERTLGWPMALSADTIVTAVGFAMGAGLVFGYYPALHASALDPIEALRTEA
jgi:putative ABC transport system permease protein